MRNCLIGLGFWLAIGPAAGLAGEGFGAQVALGSVAPPDGLSIGGAAAGDLLGTAVAADGDFNGDGWFDLAVSAPGVDVGGAQGLINAGEIYVLFGGREGLTDGFDLDALRAVNGGDGSLGFVLQGQQAGEFAGTALSFVGDINGDGLDDLLIGSENLNLGAGGGGAYLIFGRPDSDPMPAEFPLFTLIDVDDLAVNTGFGVTFASAQALGKAGHGVAGLGDVGGDGVPDFVIGNDFPTTGQVGSNQPSGTSVVYGRRSDNPWPAGLNLVFVGLSNGDGSLGFTLLSNEPGNGLGTSVDSLGDLTGDGIADFALGAPTESAEAENGGGVTIVPGRPSGPGVGFDSGLDLRDGGARETVHLLTGPSQDELLGESLAGIGDVNGDGRPDLAVGSTFSPPGGTRSGTVFVRFGPAPGAPLPEVSSLSQLLPENGGDGAQGFVLTGQPGDQLGAAIAALGDVSGDGIDDFVVGAQGLPLGGAEAGGAYVVFGRPAGSSFPARLETATISSGDGSLGFVLSGESPSDQVGGAVARGHDLNGDGGHDIIVGARFADGVGANAGRLYVLHGAGNGARVLEGPATRAWYDPDRAGEGILIEVGTLDGQPALFATWYTYLNGEQLWLAAGPFRFAPGAARVSTGLVVTGGGEFGADFDPDQVEFQPWGNVELELLACDRLAWRYQQDGEGAAGELNFVPLLPRLLGLPGCAAPDKALQFGTVLGRELGGAWWNPARAGEGIVIDIENRGPQPTAFLSWFTYAGGQQRWLVGSVPIDPDTLELTDIELVTTRGAQFGDGFDPAEVQTQAWGTATFAFDGCKSAILSYSGEFEDGLKESGSIELVRFTEGLYEFDCVDP